MKAIVPVAGRGTRLRPLTDATPKCLVEVGDGRLIDLVLATLREIPIEEIVPVVGYRAGDVVDYLGDEWEGTPVHYVRQENQEGLAHAVLQAEPVVGSEFLVLNGDNVYGESQAPTIERHRDGDWEATVLVEEVANPPASQAPVHVEDGRIRRISEHPADDEPGTPYRACGAYILPPAVFEACRTVSPSKEGERELTDAIDLLVRRGASVQPVVYDGWRRNVNDRGTLREVERRLGGPPGAGLDPAEGNGDR